MNHAFSVLPQNFVIAQLERDADLPNEVLAAPGFMSITRTDDELSIVCAEGAATGLARVDSDWRVIKVQGPFAFDQTGVLAAFLDPAFTNLFNMTYVNDISGTEVGTFYWLHGTRWYVLIVFSFPFVVMLSLMLRAAQHTAWEYLYWRLLDRHGRLQAYYMVLYKKDV